MGAVGGEELMQGPGGREEKIFVSIRLRPLNEKEASRNDVSDWECINDDTIIYRNNLSVSERSMYPTGYTFDRVFSFDCPTRQVYKEGAKDVALSVVSGINSSIFAYGQTSSGKTYTMSGITEYTVADIYDYVNKHNEREFVMKFSAMEIYNESVRDLLSADSTPLRLLDDPERGTVVEKLTEETLRDWNHFKELLSVCEAQRQIGETSLNEASSRSHQILRLTIESSSREFKGNDKSSSLSATVNFIDLAGSERASQTLSAGTRLKEGCHINRSLLTLGTVIRKLSKGRNSHVPYRDSKLTRILQSSLGGNARTAIICTLSPARSHVEQSRNTLLFASCAKEVTTSAQVNVVMSDKALVKKLQKELARLENELRCAGTAIDSAGLLWEKDLQVEKLKKEISEVTLQRDAAQSQVKDLLRAAEEDRPSVSVDLYQYYPKLRVRSSWDFENRTPRTHIFNGSQNLNSCTRSSDTSQNSDAQSSNCEENFFQIPDFDENSLPTNSSSPRLSVRIPNFIEIDLNQDESREHSDGNLDDLCKEVRCIEVEEPSTNRHVESNVSDSSPTRFINSNVSSPNAKSTISGLVVFEKEVSANEELGSPALKKTEDANSFQSVFQIPSHEKTPSQWLMEKDLSGFKGLKLTRSRSCKARLTTTLYSHWFEREEKDESTPPITFDRTFTGRPEGFQKKVPALNYGPDIGTLSRNVSLETVSKSGSQEKLSTNDSQEKLSRNSSQRSHEKLSRSGSQEILSKNGSQGSARIAGVDELKTPEIEASNDNESTSISTSAGGVEEIVDYSCEKPLADSEIPETEEKLMVSTRSVKDVGLDPIQDDVGNPPKWPSEFKRLQREIIEFWHACNVSLVHRTYFFLLFRGDPTDSIYMEVEMRRLSFLKDTFSRGNQTVEDGRTLTYASSIRALCRERLMLSKQMQKKLSKHERENIYLKWGIGLNTKHRRLQLAHRLWTNTKDMDHITESATIVVKLVGSGEPDQASKEMFGLRFTPRRTSGKYHGLKQGVKALL
ncbi:Kinesin-related protein 4 [Morus notabilis]|uniref:Kinesin-related protein 4 n=1 Tax=Morus notabilis TaxID=981085 RepID=W9SD26_9ROSA|nr:kinesin-like protein KIN-7H [Morus notabilis]EXC35389.1 Kinesin-related protein 4 [Morus notabilis]